MRQICTQCPTTTTTDKSLPTKMEKDIAAKENIQTGNTPIWTFSKMEVPNV